MANRFPLVIDTTDGSKIKEIPAGDSLDLRNNSIQDVQNINALGVINAAAITINGRDLEPGQFKDLADTPDDYSGYAGYLLRVKNDLTGLEFFQLGGGDSIDINDLTIAGDIIPTQTLNSNIGSSDLKINEIHGNFFQGSIKGNDGSTVFDATTNQIPYAVVVGGPSVISDLENDSGYITADQLKATLPEVLGEDLTIEVNQTGNLQGSVFGEDSSVLVDHINSRINTRRLMRNGANPGQTIVWDETIEEWIPGTAGDITGFASNKTDTLTVESGYKITFTDNPGVIEAQGFRFNATSDPIDMDGDVRLIGNSNIIPENSSGNDIGQALTRFANVYADTVDATTFVGTLSGNVTGNLTGNASGDHSGTFAGSITATGTLDGDITGSVFADDSTLLVDAVNKKLVSDIAFPDAQNFIEGTTIAILASNRIDLSNTQVLGDIFPENNLGGSVGTLAKRWGAGYFDVFSANTLAIDSIEATEVTTSDFNITGIGVGRIESTTDIEITVGNRVSIFGGPLRFVNFDEATRDLIAPVAGDSVYNTDEGRIQVYQSGAWVGLHKGQFDGNVQTAAGTSNFNDVVVAGNLTVQGTTTSIETTNTEIKDNTIVLNSGEPGSGVTAGESGIQIDRGSAGFNPTFLYRESDDVWTVGSTTLDAQSITGDGITIQNDGTSSQQLININAINQGEIALNATVIRLIGSIQSSITADAGVVGDLYGSVFAQDSTALVDANRGVLGGRILADDGVNTISMTDNGVQIVSTGGIDIEGAALAEINLGTGTSGTTRIGNINANIVTTSDESTITAINDMTVQSITSTVNIASGALASILMNGTTGVTDIQSTASVNVETANLNVTGNITAAAFNGSVYGDDSSVLVDGTRSVLVGELDSDVRKTSGSLTIESQAGNISMQSPGFTTDLQAQDISAQATNQVTIGGSTIELTGEINLNGAVVNEIQGQGGFRGDLKGSVVADDSTVMIDAVSGTIDYGVLINTPTIPVVPTWTTINVEPASTIFNLSVNTYYFIDSQLAAPTLNLPDINNIVDGDTIWIKDTGYAGTNSLTIATNGTDQIEGSAADVILSSNYDMRKYVYSSDKGEWLVIT